MWSVGGGVISYDVLSCLVDTAGTTSDDEAALLYTLITMMSSLLTASLSMRQAWLLRKHRHLSLVQCRNASSSKLQKPSVGFPHDLNRLELDGKQLGVDQVVEMLVRDNQELQRCPHSELCWQFKLSPPSSHAFCLQTPFMTQERIGRIEKVVAQRTYSITPVVRGQQPQPYPKLTQHLTQHSRVHLLPHWQAQPSRTLQLGSSTCLAP